MGEGGREEDKSHGRFGRRLSDGGGGMRCVVEAKAFQRLGGLGWAGRPEVQQCGDDLQGIQGERLSALSLFEH